MLINHSELFSRFLIIYCQCSFLSFPKYLPLVLHVSCSDLLLEYNTANGVVLTVFSLVQSFLVISDTVAFLS